MPKTDIPNIEIEIACRFYKAVEMLRLNKDIRGLGTLAKQWKVSRFALSWSKNHPEVKRLKIEYIYYLARDYKASLEWLFFGTGTPFKKIKL